MTPADLMADLLRAEAFGQHREPSAWQGENLMGFALMEVRARLSS